MSEAILSNWTKRYVDLAGKAALIAFFSVAATLKLFAITSLLNDWQTIPPATGWTYLAAHTSGFLFILLIIAITFVRHQPSRSAEGIEPRLSALGGTLLALSLGLLPPAELPAALTLAGVGLTALGGLLSAYVLLSLGRSFSLMAQARKLVTSGPYAVVRHPLYITEEVMAVGLMLLVFSPLAVLIAGVHWMLQLRRMTNEERVLRQAFPEYAEYAARTPKLLPRVLWSRPTSSMGCWTRRVSGWLTSDRSGKSI